MATLQLHVQHPSNGETIPVDLVSEATENDLYAAVATEFKMSGFLVLHHGETLQRGDTPLADLGLSAESQISTRTVDADWERIKHHGTECKTAKEGVHCCTSRHSRSHTRKARNKLR